MTQLRAGAAIDCRGTVTTLVARALRHVNVRVTVTLNRLKVNVHQCLIFTQVNGGAARRRARSRAGRRIRRSSATSAESRSGRRRNAVSPATDLTTADSQAHPVRTLRVQDRRQRVGALRLALAQVA